mmetsp:Transcript_13487/g.39811  ORF Transcript_13487/g.39811 Transcript_13487/m.39811 type:complete len:239 (+) Transcript_13487:922-1638(+)
MRPRTCFWIWMAASTSALRKATVASKMFAHVGHIRLFVSRRSVKVTPQKHAGHCVSKVSGRPRSPAVARSAFRSARIFSRVTWSTEERRRSRPLGLCGIARPCAGARLLLSCSARRSFSFRAKTPREWRWIWIAASTSARLYAPVPSKRFAQWGQHSRFESRLRVKCTPAKHVGHCVSYTSGRRASCSTSALRSLRTRAITTSSTDERRPCERRRVGLPTSTVRRSTNLRAKKPRDRF